MRKSKCQEENFSFSFAMLLEFCTWHNSGFYFYIIVGSTQDIKSCKLLHHTVGRDLIIFHIEVAFGQFIFCQLILLFSLYLLLFMSLIALFGTIYEFHCTISTDLYLYLQYFQQKIFNFNKISRSQTGPFGKNYFCQLILPFSLFLLLFMDPTTLFGTIHRPHCTVSVNFYLYLQYFQQKVFNFSKINGSQTDLEI